MKFKFIKLILPLAALGVLLGCKEATEPYKDKIIVGESESTLKVDLTNFNSTFNSGDSIDTSKIKVKFNNIDVEYENSTAEAITPDKFFITKSQTTPSLSRVKSNSLKLTTNSDRTETGFYIGYLSSKGDKNLYVSNKISIVIINSKALKPWVYWVVSGVVILGVVGLVVFTKKYKETHP